MVPNAAELSAQMNSMRQFRQVFSAWCGGGAG